MNGTDLCTEIFRGGQHRGISAALAVAPVRRALGDIFGYSLLTFGIRNEVDKEVLHGEALEGITAAGDHAGVVAVRMGDYPCGNADVLIVLGVFARLLAYFGCEII